MTSFVLLCHHVRDKSWWINVKVVTLPFAVYAFLIVHRSILELEKMRSYIWLILTSFLQPLSAFAFPCLIYMCFSSATFVLLLPFSSLIFSALMLEWYTKALPRISRRLVRWFSISPWLFAGHVPVLSKYSRMDMLFSRTPSQMQTSCHIPALRFIALFLTRPFCMSQTWSVLADLSGTDIWRTYIPQHRRPVPFHDPFPSTATPTLSLINVKSNMSTP